MAKLVAGWLLQDENRHRLLARFSPAYPRVVAHHVTLRAGVRRDVPPTTEAEGSVTGTAAGGASY